ncbi:hypothetical protein V6N13_065539 [Hibiscus sabdariffa]
MGKNHSALVLVSELIPLEYIIDRGNRFVEEFRRAFSRQVVAYGANASEALWARPLVGWIKVNVDVAVSTSVNKAGIGVVFETAMEDD